MREQLSSMPGLWMNEKHPSARRPAIPPPRGTPNQTFGPVFWLAFNLLQRLPMREHSGELRSCQAYSSGGCTGISAKQSTGFPFHPLHGRRARHPKRSKFYAIHPNSCKRIHSTLNPEWTYACVKTPASLTIASSRTSWGSGRTESTRASSNPTPMLSGGGLIEVSVRSKNPPP